MDANDPLDDLLPEDPLPKKPLPENPPPENSLPDDSAPDFPMPATPVPDSPVPEPTRAEKKKSREERPVASAPARLRWRQRLWLRWRPTLRQAWLNIRVWVPFLLNPFERKRLVRYTARESREGLNWALDLPTQCWKCGADEDLRIRRVNGEVRAFEYPVAVVAGTLLGMIGVCLAQCLLGIWLTAGLCLAILSLGTLVFFMKSWRERVQLELWTCEADEPEYEGPQLVAYEEELHVFLPTARLAKAAESELKARRRGRRAEDERPF